MMVNQVFEDLRETGDFFFHGWRCVNCGEIIDPIIASNRGLEVELHKKDEGIAA